MIKTQMFKNDVGADLCVCPGLKAKEKLIEYLGNSISFHLPPEIK
jgi:hypothetical protein